MKKQNSGGLKKEGDFIKNSKLGLLGTKVYGYVILMCLVCILGMTACAQETAMETTGKAVGETTSQTETKAAKPADEIIQSLDESVLYTSGGGHYGFQAAEIRNMELSYYDKEGELLWKHQLPGTFTFWKETEYVIQPIFQLYELSGDRCAVLVQFGKEDFLWEEQTISETAETELFTYLYVYDATGAIVHQTELPSVTGRMEAKKPLTGKKGARIYLAVFTGKTDEKCCYTEFIWDTDSGKTEEKQIPVVQMEDTNLEWEEGDPEPVYEAFYWNDKLAILSDLYGVPNTAEGNRYISSKYVLQVYDSDTGKVLWDYHAEADHKRKKLEQVGSPTASFTVLTKDSAVLAFPEAETYTMTVLDASGHEVSTRNSLNYAYPIGHKNKDGSRFLFDLSGSYTEYYIADENLTWEAPVEALSGYVFLKADFYDEYFIIYEGAKIEDSKVYQAIGFSYSGEKIWEVPH